jgi:mannose-6-phosphate isomerase-like protein (cupin superfamily)
MRVPDIIYLQQLAWTPSPIVAGVEVKYFANDATYPPNDLMILKLEPAQQLRWHVHETDAEVSYVLQGQAQLLYAENEAHQEVYEHELTTGMAYILPANIWHSFVNMGEEQVLMFSLHVRENHD